MFEANAFLAMFVVQIVALTVVYPARLIKRLGDFSTRYPQEQFPQLYPPGLAAAERRMGITFVVLNTVVAVAGLALLGWAFTYMRRPDWDDDPVKTLVFAFFLLQVIPFAVFFLTAAKYFKKWRKWFQIDRRTATLERRGFFDFVSSFLVFLALLCYPLLIGLVLYTEQDRSDALVIIGAITLMYAIFAFGVYASLYGKKHPLQTHEDRMRAMEINVKGSVYSCLGTVVFLALTFTLNELDLEPWVPFAVSVFFVFCGSMCFRNILKAIPRELELDGLRPTLPAERTASSPS